MKQWEMGRSQTPLPPERRAEVPCRVPHPDLQKARRVAEVESETGRPAGYWAPRRGDTPLVAGRAARPRPDLPGLRRRLH